VSGGAPGRALRAAGRVGKKDLFILAAVAALALAAFVVARRDAPVPARGGDPYRPAAGEEALIAYRAEGGLSPFSEVAIEARGPEDCVVRYRVHGAQLVEKRHPLGEARFEDLLARLGRADFFTVDEVPRSGYLADMPAVTISLRIGGRENHVTIDGRHRPSRDLEPILAAFEEIRKDVTPEPVSSGD
jgi:hypothetical protein